MQRTLVAILALVLLVAAACGNDDAPAAQPEASPTATVTPTAEATPTPTATPEPSPTATPEPEPTPTATAETSGAVPERLSDRPLTYAEEGTVEADIERAHWAQWDAYFDAIEEPVDPNHPDLLATTGEPLLALAQSNIQDLVDNGWATRSPDTRFPIAAVLGIEMQTDEEALVFACTLDDGVVYDIATGETLQDEVASLLWETTMRLEDGRWKAVDGRVLDDVEGVGGCIEAEPASS